MMRVQHQQIIATVAYADVFDCPLTRDEVSMWGIGRATRSISIPRVLLLKHGYVVFSKREQTIRLRNARRLIAVRKWNVVRRITTVFSWIPTIELISVTGGLAMDNARDDDDIDVFFIAKRGTLWITRMMATFVAEVMGVRRRPHDSSVSDKVCLNMFMADDHLSLPESERDLFAAHEVLQMKPLFDRGGVHTRMLMANRWVSYFLPNAWKKVFRESKESKAAQPSGSVLRVTHILACMLEPVAKFVQLQYMKNKRTNEVIRSGMIRFHPKDARVWIYKKFQKRLTYFDIPIDKFFYHR